MMRRRRPLDPRELVGPGLIAMLAAGLVATFVTAFALSGGQGEELVGEGSPTVTTTVSPGPGGVVNIDMIPTIKFDQADLTIVANSPVEVLADNRDTGVLHNFALYTDDTAKETLGKTVLCTAPCQERVTLNLQPGIYFFRCDVHPTQMVGTLTAQ